jgi:two-component system, LytTR family, response regulator
MQKLKKQYFKQLDDVVYDTEIKYLEAEINYTKVYFANGLIKKSGYTLMRFEELLKQNTMYKRIHRAFIVNMNFVENIDLKAQNIAIANGPTLQISRRKLQKLESFFRAKEA